MNTIGNTMENGKLSFTRLFFKKSKNKKGEECYISKVKNYDILSDGKKKFLGDAIVIANTCGSQKSTINKEGRWDVKVKKMDKGSGYVVVDAVWTLDRPDFSISGVRVAFTINGREEKLKTDDGKYIPLYFDAKNWYDPEIVFHNIERKMKFLQLGADFSLSDFKSKFITWCEEAEKEHKYWTKKEKKQKITKTDEKIVDEDSLHALREKWDAKYSKSKK